MYKILIYILKILKIKAEGEKNMEFSKYKKLIVLFGISLATALFYFIFALVRTQGSTFRGMTPLIPVNNSFLENFIMVLIIYPLSAIVGAFIGGYVLVPIFLFFHKKVIGRNLIYGIQVKTAPTKLKNTFRAFFPTLMALNLAFFLKGNENLVESILYPEYYSQITYNQVGVYWGAIMVFLMFTQGIAFLLFSPAWFLLDAGITYTNKKKVEGTDHPTEVHSVGGFFINFLKGYAGIGVVFTYYQFISEIFALWSLELSQGDIGLMVSLSIYIIMIPLLALFLTIAIILLEVTKRRRIKFVKKVARKFGIIDTIDVSFELITIKEGVPNEFKRD